MAKQTIVVAGDLVRDHYLLELPYAPQSYYDPSKDPIRYILPGGAWLTEDFVKLMCADLEETVEVVPLPLFESTGVAMSDAYTTWRQYPHTTEPDDKQKSWRAAQFLGCNPPLASTPTFGDERHEIPDVLVLDDLGLGFRNNKKLWPRALGATGNPRRIILKTCPQFDEGELWEILLERFADRLTVVLTIQTLRAHGAALGETLSWDAALEGLKREFKAGGLFRMTLGRCRRVIIGLGDGAVATFSRVEPNLDKTLASGQVTGECPDLELLVHTQATCERLVYTPGELEETWAATRPGTTFGGLTLLAAAATRHAVCRTIPEMGQPAPKIDTDKAPTDYRPLTLLLGRALATKRQLHASGGWVSISAKSEVLPKGLSAREAFIKVLTPVDEVVAGKTVENEPANEFAVAACRRPYLTDDELREEAGIETCAGVLLPCCDEAVARQCSRCTTENALVYNVTGYGLDYLTAKAIEVVMNGAPKALEKAPQAKYRQYLTVDREEVERINAIRNLIVNYQHNPKDTRPLSIAVFGQPGSGKSFAITQLAKTLFPEDQAAMTFNLSQLTLSSSDLTEALHRVGDASVKGCIPLVFWDEFDSNGLVWLKEFLAPMQDATFFKNGIDHPLGKAIFVFAGGTAVTFDQFCGDLQHPSEADKEVKKPDFISRLRGYLNVKGPNPSSVLDAPAIKLNMKGQNPSAVTSDPAFVLRRAMLLRSLLERYYPHLIDAEQRAAVRMDVVHGLLHVENYRHGARSLEAVLSTSRLEDADCFTASCLPAQDLLNLHVTPDLLERIRAFPFTEDVVRDVARATHNAWYAERLKQQRPDNNNYKPFAELTADEQINNDESAWHVDAKLRDVGIAVKRHEIKVTLTFTPDQLCRLYGVEHDIWVRKKLVQGFEWAPLVNKRWRLHIDVAPLEFIPDPDKKLDEAIVDALPEVLGKRGLA